MEQKETYTLKELYDNLGVPYAKLGKMADMSEGTVTRIRDGYPARRTTLNRLLSAFSEIYKLKISLENVTGVQIEDKHGPNKGKKPPALEEAVKPEKALDRIVEPKRTYNRKKDSGLPDGCILATEFGLMHGIARETFRGHMNVGKGPGLIHGPDVPEDGSVQVKDYIHYEERNKRVKKDGTIETERYLTPAQQTAALDFWRRHGVPFTMPDTEQDAKQETAWYLPD
jgi:hypothetical protein